VLVGLGVAFLMCIRFENVDISFGVEGNFFQFLSGLGRLSNIISTKIVLHSI